MIITINGSVGEGGANFVFDVKRIQALANIYLRQSERVPLQIDGRCSPNLESVIRDFMVGHMNLPTTSTPLIKAGSAVLRGMQAILDNVFKPQALSTPSFGIVTWESEGTEGGIYHSRKLHVPSHASGLTLGRGYDCRRKTRVKLTADLSSIGLACGKVTLLSTASGLFGTTAEQFIIDNDLLDFQLTPAQQCALFEISYKDELNEVLRICGKRDVVQLYGPTDWEALHPAIKGLVVDLKFRGDYRSDTRRVIQKSIVNNDLEGFRKHIKNRELWKPVPPDRFQRRVAYMDKAVSSSGAKRQIS